MVMYHKQCAVFKGMTPESAIKQANDWIINRPSRYKDITPDWNVKTYTGVQGFYVYVYYVEET